MSTEVENRIVNLEFNNKDFEKHAAQSMQTVDTLKKKLDFSGVKTGFEGIINAAKFLGSGFKGAINGATNLARGLSNISSAALHPIRNIEQLTGTVGVAEKSFSMLEEISIGALRRLGEQAVQTGEQLVKSLTVDQLAAGWEKFGEKTRSVASIMSATGYSAEEVADKLEKLNWYTDETSYAYTDMTNNISKFTNAGIELDDAITAMIGIGNAAGLAGSSVQDASHAMSGFSKAMSKGYMDRQNWSWIETAHMDTVQFKQALIDAGEELGAIEQGTVDVNNLVGTLTEDKWLTTDVMVKALKAFGGTTEMLYEFMKQHPEIDYTSEAIEQLGVAEDDLGLKAFKASQEARTFADAIDSVKDAVSTGFMTAIEHLIGNYDRAKKLWTDLANNLWDVFAQPISDLNDALDDWEDLGGQDLLNSSIYKFMDTVAEYIQAFKDAVTEVFGVLDADRLMSITEYIDKIATAFEETIDNGTMDAIVGVWKEFLTIIKTVFDVAMDVKDVLIDGFEYASDVFETVSDSVKEVSDSVEEVVETVEEATEDLEKMYQAVFDIWTKGSLGNGEARKKILESMGLDYDSVQSWVNKLANGTYKSIDDLEKDMLGVADDIKDSGDDVSESLTDNVSDVVDEVSKGSRDVEKVYDAIEQIWNKNSLGTGATRRTNLEAMGLDADYVQEYVNKLARGEYKSLDELKASLVSASGEVADEIVDDVEEVEEAVTEATTPIGKAMNKLRELLSAVGDGFKKAFEFANEDGQLFSIALGVKTVVDIFKTAFSSLVDSFKRTNALKNLVQAVVNPFANIGSLLYENVKLSRISAIVTDISYAFTALTNVVKLLSDAFSEAFVDTFLKIDVTKTISNKIVGITNFFNNIYKTFKDNDRLTRITKGLASAIRLVSKVIDKVIGAIKPGVKKFFPELVEFIATIADLIADVADNDDVIAAIAKNVMTAVDHTATKITILINVIKTLIVVAAKVIDYIVRLAAALIDKFSGSTAFSRVVESFKRLGDAISNLFGKNKEGLSETVDELGKTGEEASSSFDWLDGVVVIIDTIATAISGLVDGIANVITWIDAFIDKIQNGGSGITADIDKGNAKSSIFGAIGYGLSHIFDAVDLDAVSKGAGVMGASIFGALGSYVGEFFENANIDTKEVMILGRFIGLLMALIELNKLMTTANTFTKTLAQFPLKSTGLSWIIDLKNILGGITGVLTQTKNSIKKLTEMNMLQTFVYSLIGVALTVALLAEIPEGKLAKGVVYLGIIATIVAVFAKIMSKLNPSLTEINKISNSNNVTKTFNLLSGNNTTVNAGPVGVAAALLALAAVALSIAGAMSMIANLNWDDGTADKAAAVMLAFLTAVTLLLAVVAGFGKSIENTSVTETKWGKNVRKGPGGYFANVAVFMASLASTMAVLMGSIVAIAWAGKQYGTENIDKAVVAFGVVMLALVAILGFLALLIKFLGSSKITKASRLSVIAETTNNPISNIGSTMLMIAASLAIISIAVSLLVPTIATLAYVFKDVKLSNWGDILPVMSSFFMIVATLVIAIAAVIDWIHEYKVNPTDVLIIAAAMAVVSIAIDLLIPIIATFGVIEAISAQNGSAGASLMVASSVAIMIAALALIVYAMAKGSKSISAVDASKMISFGAALLLASVSFTVIAGALAGMAYVMKKNNATWKDAGSYALIVGGVLVAFMVGLGLLFSAINKMNEVPDNTIKTLTSSMLLMVGAFVAIAAALTIMDQLKVGAGRISLYMGIITGAMFILVGIIAALFVVLKYVAPGSETLVVEALKALAYIMLAMAALMVVSATAFSASAALFAYAIKTLTDCMPTLTKELPAFGDVLSDFCKKMSSHIGELIASSFAIGVLIVAVAWSIGILIAAFAAFLMVFNTFDDDTKKSMIKTTKTVAGLMIAIGAAILAATPQMLEYVKAAIQKVSYWLSELAPQIADSLLMFVLRVLDGLAEALGKNSKALLYYITKIVTSLVLSIAQMGNELRKAGDNLVDAILEGLFGEDMAKNIRNFVNTVNKIPGPHSLLGPFNKMRLAAELTGVVDWEGDDWDKLREKAYDKVSEIVGYDPSQLDKEAKIDFVTNIFGGEDTESDIYDATNSMATAAVGGLVDAGKEAVDTYGPEIKEKFIKAINEGTGINVSELIGSDGINIEELKKTLGLGSAIGVDFNMDKEFVDKITNLGYSVEDFGFSTEGILSDVDTSWLSSMSNVDAYMTLMNGSLTTGTGAMEDTLNSYLDSVDASSEDALNDADGTLNGMVTMINDFNGSFYSAGSLLIDNLRMGMEAAFEKVHQVIVGNLAEDLYQAAYMSTGDRLGTDAAKRAWEIQHGEEDRINALKDAVKASADAERAAIKMQNAENALGSMADLRLYNYDNKESLAMADSMEKGFAEAHITIDKVESVTQSYRDTIQKSAEEFRTAIEEAQNTVYISGFGRMRPLTDTEVTSNAKATDIVDNYLLMSAAMAGATAVADKVSTSGLQPVVDTSYEDETQRIIDNAEWVSGWFTKADNTSAQLASDFAAAGKEVTQSIENNKYDDTEMVRAVNQLSNKIDVLNNNVSNQGVYIDGKVVCGYLAPEMNRQLGSLQVRAQRGGGR